MMSYDISLLIATGGDEPFEITNWNYTSNMNRAWKEAGVDLVEFDNKLASECIPMLSSALAAIQNNPAKYKKFEPPNDWGSYQSLINALHSLLSQMEKHPKATVSVSN